MIIAPCQTTANATTPAASCRIHNQLPGGATNIGSGTLIDVMPGGERGLILTCAHLFSEGKGRVVVEFPGGKTHGALVVAVDAAADLAALEIARPAAAPAVVDRELRSTGNLTACGFGPSGAYRCVAGPAIGFSNGPGQTSVRIAGAVRSGDSGGGVFDEQGRLVAVVWGESSGVTYASTGGPLSRFLDRALQRRGVNGAGQGATSPSASPSACPDGRCPLIGRGLPLSEAPTLPFTLAAPITPTAPNQSCDCGAAMAALAARLEGLDARRQPSEPADGDALPSTFSAATRAAAALLGVSGPAGWGAIAASSVGGWLIGRGLKRRKLRAASSELREEEPPSRQPRSSNSKLATRRSQLDSEATAAAAGAFPSEPAAAVSITEQSPIERDDREARELLRLSQLEGRDPLQDAVAGRLVLDRLDATAEGDPDPDRVRWADELRRELRERFNEIAPTKFKVRNDEFANDE